MSIKIRAEHLERSAVVYVLQSTPSQVMGNQESQRRQYQLQDRAQQLGFKTVQLIDDDLGLSGSGLVDRPGFERLVASVCAGSVGAVFCLEASRLARNGKDWHHLIDLCGLVDTLIVDADGVYDARLSNDRLLLGLKGSMSEFELSLLRQRSLEAIRAKAQRGELRFCLPAGLCWTENGKIELDPDRRVQQAITIVFEKFVELGSVRQVLMWLREEQLWLPRIKDNKNSTPQHAILWRPAQYMAVLAVIRNPFYAGAYAYGRSEARTRVVAGKAQRSSGHKKPRGQWTVLIRDHHRGYISWEQYERNQRVLAENTYMKQTISRKSARGGQGLLAGLLRCARCGRMLHMMYRGGSYPRYECRLANREHGAPRCISFGGARVDEAVGAELLSAVEPYAVEAAIAAAERAQDEDEGRGRARALELEEARYAARLAAKRYEAVDPENRLVAGELEQRWEAAMVHVKELEDRLASAERAPTERSRVDAQMLMRLAEELPLVWGAASSDMRLKQRIVRILVKEIVADIDEERAQILMTIHWEGGRHSELRVQRPKPGEVGRVTGADALAVVRRMAGQWPDKEIAATLNRLGLKTGAGNTWTESRVYSVRGKHELPAYDPARADGSTVTLNQAADRLGVGAWVVRRLIRLGVLSATQPIRFAPWQIDASALDSNEVRRAAAAIRARSYRPRVGSARDQNLTIPGV